MELESLLKLIDKVSSSKLDEFHYNDGSLKLHLKKNAAAKKGNVPASEHSEPSVPASAVLPDIPEPEAAADTKQIKAPLVGTFYASSAPDAPAFVAIGDQVKKGQVLGVIEAMKLMNEIECEYDGVIESILVENEQMVEYGQPLFTIR